MLPTSLTKSKWSGVNGAIYLHCPRFQRPNCLSFFKLHSFHKQRNTPRTTLCPLLLERDMPERPGVFGIHINVRSVVRVFISRSISRVLRCDSGSSFTAGGQGWATISDFACDEFWTSSIGLSSVESVQSRTMEVQVHRQTSPQLCEH